MAAAIVAHGGTDVLRNDGAVVRQKLFNRLAGQGWGRFQCLIQVGHVSVVMLAVMDLHGHFVDVRLQRIGRVGQRR